MTFQEIILALEKFWSDYGCVIQQPYDVEVGAGTFNPATFLRCLGPEPWHVAYVEPVRRPTDGRYAENPFRLGAYYQYQVILKPAPENVLQLYLESLYHLGISARQNDIRFVEDDWESPTLGASGLGWEVWWNGAEVTQFTYFQQMGSIELKPVCAEITYGLERIALYLQDVDSFFDIRWNENACYGDVYHQSEVEHSIYNFQRADVEMLFQLFGTYEKETYACLDTGLVLPATDYVLKCSHTFNMLDARGVISVTERINYIERVRRLAQRIARAYVKQREEMEHPLRGKWVTGNPRDSAQHHPPPKPISQPNEIEQMLSTEKTELLFEIGTEEIPASYVPPALEQLRLMAAESFTHHRITVDEVKVFGTPRRITLAVKELATCQEAREIEVVGPPKRIAYDEDGVPTKAAIGFAKTQGVGLTELRIVETSRGAYVAVTKREKGVRTEDILKTLLPDWIEKLRFPKTMRWFNEEESNRKRFARPIRWLVALLGDKVIPCTYGSVTTGRLSYGHRSLHPEPIPLVSASLDTYVSQLRNANVIVEQDERRETIKKQLLNILKTEGCLPKIDEELLDTVNYLVENPQPIVGSFNESHLVLPPEVLITAMKKHQRYFPLWKAKSAKPKKPLTSSPGAPSVSSIQNRFITISNGTDGNFDGVRHGNERVLHARLNDAEFFYREDRKTTLADKVERLDTVVFHAKLGSLLDKAKRLKKLVRFIGRTLQLPEATCRDAERAAWLCKADLTTQLVIELPTLQGIAGKYYAENAGEVAPVANAIAEHYHPLGADTPVPETEVGALIAIADKLDTIVGYFGIEERPTGSQDAYSLRRHALGTLRILEERQLHLSLDIVVEKAFSLYQVELAADTVANVLSFIKERLRGILQIQGNYAPDVADAVLASDDINVPNILKRADVIAKFKDTAQEPENTSRETENQLNLSFELVYNALNRVLRILPETPPVDVNETLLIDEAEKSLAARIIDAEPHFEKSVQTGDYSRLLIQLAELQPAIERFFDDVLVMAKEPEIRENRLALLNRIAKHIYTLADLTKLVIAGERKVNN